MKEAKLKGFTEVVLVSNVSENVSAVIQCVGMGSLRPNTVVVGWPNNWKNRLQKKNKKYWNFLGFFIYYYFRKISPTFIVFRHCSQSGVQSYVFVGAQRSIHVS